MTGRGQIAVGMPADMVILGGDGSVQKTVVGGIIN